MRRDAKRITRAIGVLIVALASIVTQDAYAQRRDFRDFHGREFRWFSLQERRLWMNGRWIHDYHNGRLGWWWLAGGFWYFYPEPIYPYPTYVPPPEVVVNEPPPPPPGGYYPPPQGYPPPSGGYGPPPTGAPPPASYWYYCVNPPGYYPYIPNCAGPWKEVPTTPPNLPSPPQYR
jgi:hypothetical protein